MAAQVMTRPPRASAVKAAKPDEAICGAWGKIQTAHRKYCKTQPAKYVATAAGTGFTPADATSTTSRNMSSRVQSTEAARARGTWRRRLSPGVMNQRVMVFMEFPRGLLVGVPALRGPARNGQTGGRGRHKTIEH